MSHMNNLNFPDYMFALSLLHTKEDNFGKRKHHKMQELSIRREQMNLVLEKSASAFCTGSYGNRNSKISHF